MANRYRDKCSFSFVGRGLAPADSRHCEFADTNVNT